MTQVIVKRKNEDELAHAKYIKKDKINGKWRYYYDHNDGDGWSNKTGVSVEKTKSGKKVSVFSTKADKYWNKHQKTRTKKYGPVTVDETEAGTNVSVDIPTKKIASYSKKHIKKGKKLLKKIFGK